jgi:adenosine deaminase
MSLPLSFFERLPKTDLHVHLDGSLRVKTILELADQDGIQLPEKTPEALLKAMNCGLRTGSLVEYLKAFDVTLKVLQTEESLARVAYELCEDAAAENVRYMEIRYAPMLHTSNGLRLTAVVEAVLSGVARAREELGIHAKVIVCGIRNISPESSLEMARLAVAYKNRGVVGFDLAGAEYDYPPKHHRDGFELIRKNNINCTIHAGEAFGPESIAQAIHTCGAHRIGHGCRLWENGDLLAYVNDHRIPLECCPSSNVQTGAVPELARHPIKLYHDLGLRVTVNTDNRLITDTTVSRELWLCHTQLGMSLAELKHIVLNGFKAAFLPFHQRQDYVRRIVEELKAFHEDGTIVGDSLPPEPIKKASLHPATV